MRIRTEVAIDLIESHGGCDDLMIAKLMDEKLCRAWLAGASLNLHSSLVDERSLRFLRHPHAEAILIVRGCVVKSSGTG